MDSTIAFGDCRSTMRGWASRGVKAQMCVTSPPYFGLRDYKVEGQLGLEPTPDEYIANMVEVFRAVRDVLADDGTLWLNIGDSYNAHPGQRKTTDSAGSKQQSVRGATAAPSRSVEGMKAKDLIGIPWMLAFALRADGWYLRQDIIWHKPNPMPESVRDRCTKAHEYLFLLSKSEKYYFDANAIKEPAVKGACGSKFDTGKTGAHQMGHASTKPRKQNSTNESFVPGATAHGGLHREGSEREPETRNRRSVWTVATRPYTGAHFATFPPALIEPCILAGSRPGDIVLDPFMGSGTTAEVAVTNMRGFLGCELNTEYAPLQTERIAKGWAAWSASL